VRKASRRSSTGHCLGRAPGRRHISLATRNPAGVIEHTLDRFGRQSRTVVGDDDLATLGRYFDADLRRDPGFFRRVQRVIDQFLEDDQRPVLDVVTGLRDQLFPAAELCEPRGFECDALQGRRGRLRGSAIGIVAADCQTVKKCVTTRSAASSPTGSCRQPLSPIQPLRSALIDGLLLGGGGGASPSTLSAAAACLRQR
jgi:hypothetical protein